MSARARAIVVHATDDRMVLRATAADVARFGKGAAVDVGPAGGALTLEEARRFCRQLDDQPMLPGKMPALLRTACGCTQWRVVDRRPPSVVKVPVLPAPGLSPSVYEVSRVRYHVRTFSLRDIVVERKQADPWWRAQVNDGLDALFHETRYAVYQEEVE